MRSIVYLLTTNPKKHAEWQSNFDRYGITVERLSPDTDAPEIARLLRSGDADRRILAVCREESDLYRRGTHDRSDRRHLELVDNVTDLTVHFIKNDAVTTETYRHVTEGFVDRSKDATESDGGWWDTIFRLEGTLLTYEEMRRLGFKHSSRDMAISRFLLDRVHYKKPVDLKFNPQSPTRTISFDDSVARFVAQNELLQNPWARKFGLTGVFESVVDSGVFFRAAKNRREKIYWWPGLNAGIPFVPKKDEVHELTYMVHDFCHFLVPDLIYTGTGGEETRRTYITYRMLSEAITLVLADMVFVDSLVRSGVAYDWTKRRIYPLFADLGVNLGENFLERVEAVLRANVAYCLKGDPAPYKKLLAANGKLDDSLDAFREKYMPFFVEDFRWTARNFEDMSRRKDELARWWSSVAALRAAAKLDLETVDEFRAKTGASVEAIFERIFAERVRPALAGQRARPSPEQRRGRAFARYVAGQLGVFARYRFVKESALYRDRILEVLLERGTDVSDEEIARVRAFYERFVDLLAGKNLLTLDDAATYKEVFPLFEPFYVFYDAAPGSYEDLASVSKRILG